MEIFEEEVIVDPKQISLFPQAIDLFTVDSVIGSGYETDVATLAILDKIAYRAARKNMQIHSAVILKINGVFKGFFTFQINHDAKEFCLLQSAIYPDTINTTLYSMMVMKIIEHNTFGYPAIITTDPRSKYETPKLFKSLGFKTYLKMGQFEYMVHGKEADVRIKFLAHITMTNVWNSVKGDWLRTKKEWNAKIEAAGLKHGILNAKYATREGCWQGVNGMSNVILSERVIDDDGSIRHEKGKSFNHNASVLDPTACEIILRMFMPKQGFRVYNPFGGGVQFGFITGSYEYEYMATEIRQNQCDANNAICQDFYSTRWIKADSSTYAPHQKYDLVFTCPPYYKVEEYLDYDGASPDGEINSLDTYEKFRDTLFAGYKKAIEALNDNCFFVVMVGDSRGKDTGYYGCEAEHELFFKSQGLLIYNKIVYLESEFTRLAHAKKTLHHRKFPKREQKILCFYKGNVSKIKDLYPNIGRL